MYMSIVGPEKVVSHAVIRHLWSKQDVCLGKYWTLYF